ncbi:acyl-homoserine-lactone synthase [Tropicibacter oceani]|uniref:Acyl-homoserine-lactone synthase n=1 Tax=Tropicibacter oceani TaxID=3058420 RepID=A0ABY8QKH7_9RHOB|nr:acyl-homoserine-lactone synthase [Tropicibacter oceani]WGW04531.1 acyl-homoserine-lactone synthase [Tropicibacter oceani]
MFTTIQPHEVKQNSKLMADVFRLRKRVFADQLGWDVPVHEDMEKDAYDDMGASYLVWCSDDKATLYGVVRLMPTEGPTLLHDVFHATHGRNPDLIDRTVWEGTRMCLDDALIARDFPDLPAAQGFNLLFLALCEAALAHNIRRMVSNFEPCMSRVYRRAGLAYDIHGRADGYGAKPVYCASFAVTQDVLATICAKIGVHEPVFERSRGFTPLVAPVARPIPELA